MRFALFTTLMATTLSATALSASAQFADAISPSARAQQVDAQLRARFAAADTNHDGRLTRDEANGRMPLVATEFDAIDKTRAGFVTIEQIQMYLLERQKTRRENTYRFVLYRW